MEKMSTGYGTQLTRQIGEHLVVAKLGRRRILAPPFSGNVPDYDLLASDLSGHPLPLQVKAINGLSWQFNASSFLQIDSEGDRQIIRGKKKLPNSNLICVLVILNKNENDAFYILRKGDLQEIIFQKYTSKARNDVRVRPKNPKSTHCAIWPEDLGPFLNNWNLITDHFDPIG